MSEGNVQEEIRAFIRRNFIFDGQRTLDNEESLIGSGIMDSTGILELISFLEDTYAIQFSDSELVAANFESVKSVTLFVTEKISKMSTGGAAAIN